jgi:hypothetical protein
MISLSSNNSLNDLEIKNERQPAIEESINRSLLHVDDENKKYFSFKCPFNAIKSSIIGIIIVTIVITILVITKNISS